MRKIMRKLLCQLGMINLKKIRKSVTRLKLSIVLLEMVELLRKLNSRNYYLGIKEKEVKIMRIKIKR